MMDKLNTAVLVVDDEELVRNNIEEILVPRQTMPDRRGSNAAVDILFDEKEEKFIPRTNVIPTFTVDKASNGIEGVELVKKALAAGRPYALIFLDVRMPIWDGLETAVQIRKHDSRAEIVFITAYSDRSIEDIVSRAGPNVGYQCKPYTSEEIILLATKAIADYNRLLNMECLIESISSIGLDQFHLDLLLENVLHQLAALLDTDTALLRKIHDDLTYENVSSIGDTGRINLDEIGAKTNYISGKQEDVVQINDLILVRMHRYVGFMALKKPERLKTEKLYVLKLFVQSAAQIIRSAELNEALLQKEKLSVVGKAMGMVMHDLRSPVKMMKPIIKMIREQGQQDELMEVLDQCAGQASEIFDDFLDFIKESPVKQDPVNLHRVTDAAVVLVRGSFGRGAVIIRQSVPEDIVIRGDESKFRRVLLNLISNAAEALLYEKVDSPAIHITAGEEEVSGEVYMKIRDNGPGIPQDIQKTLFDPFVTRGKGNSGTGLGLAIVKQYVTAHGATITASNDAGAVFTISGLKSVRK